MCFPLRIALIRFVVASAAVGIVCILCSTSACSSDEDADAKACIEIAKKCTRDDECCSTLKCMWQQDGAYCQLKSAQDPPCSKGDEGCTQASHCCSKTCNPDGKCTASAEENPTSSGGSSGTTGNCKPTGAECTSSSLCCSRLCNGVCQAQDPTGPPTGGCGILGDLCQLPAQCCSNNCVVGHCQN